MRLFKKKKEDREPPVRKDDAALRKTDPVSKQPSGPIVRKSGHAALKSDNVRGVLCWGGGDPTPRQLRIDRRHGVVRSVHCGRKKVAFLTKRNKLLLCPTPGKFTIDDEVEPVPFDEEKEISDVSIGDTVAAIITKEGELYMWSIESKPDKAVAPDFPPTPQPVRGLQGLCVKSVALGLNFFFAVVLVEGKPSKTNVYAWGDNHYSQLGTGGKVPCQQPTVVKALSNRNIQQISCGDHHAAALTGNFRVYVWGRNHYPMDDPKGKTGNCLGVGVVDECVLLPTAVLDLFDVDLVHVSCGSTFIAAVSSDGGLYMWGQGRLITGDKPTRVEALEGVRVCSVAAGPNHVTAVGEGGQLWCWGSGVEGVLGHAAPGLAPSSQAVVAPASRRLADVWTPTVVGGIVADAVVLQSGGGECYSIALVTWDSWQPVFEGHLWQVMIQEPDADVPSIVSCCVTRLRQELDTEGLFRISGSLADVVGLVDKFNSSPTVDLKGYSVHAVASTLKKFLVSLKHPLIPEVPPSLLDEPDHIFRAYKTYNLLHSLPDCNKGLVLYLLCFLFEVTQHSNKNLMTASNLGVIFGQSLFPPATNIEQTKPLNTLAETMVTLAPILSKDPRQFLDGHTEGNIHSSRPQLLETWVSLFDEAPAFQFCFGSGTKDFRDVFLESSCYKRLVRECLDSQDIDIQVLTKLVCRTSSVSTKPKEVVDTIVTFSQSAQAIGGNEESLKKRASLLDCLSEYIAQRHKSPSSVNSAKEGKSKMLGLAHSLMECGDNLSILQSDRALPEYKDKRDKEIGFLAEYAVRYKQAQEAGNFFASVDVQRHFVTSRRGEQLKLIDELRVLAASAQGVESSTPSPRFLAGDLSVGKQAESAGMPSRPTPVPTHARKGSQPPAPASAVPKGKPPVPPTVHAKKRSPCQSPTPPDLSLSANLGDSFFEHLDKYLEAERVLLVDMQRNNKDSQAGHEVAFIMKELNVDWLFSILDNTLQWLLKCLQTFQAVSSSLAGIGERDLVAACGRHVRMLSDLLYALQPLLATGHELIQGSPDQALKGKWQDCQQLMQQGLDLNSRMVLNSAPWA